MITRNVISQIGGNASVIKTNTQYQAIATTTIVIFCATAILTWGLFKQYVGLTEI